MNSFDSMIERYKKELIDAKKRSISQQLKELSENEQPLAVSAEVQTGEEEQPTAAAFAAESESRPPEEKQPQRLPDSADDERRTALEKTDSLTEEESDSQSFGALKVQVFMAGRAYPVSSANVVITGRDGRVYFDGFTDTDGAISRLLLPAPKKQLSQSPQETPPYAQYDIFVSHPRFQSRKYLGVPVFAGVESVQNIQLLPLGTDEEDNTDVSESEPNELLMKDGESNA